MPQTPSAQATSEVLEVDISTSSSASPAKGHHSSARRGCSTAAATMTMKPRVMLPPRSFFSVHSPRQAPGNRVGMIPKDGTSTAASSDPTARMAKAVAMTSARAAQLKRAAITTAQTVVSTRATTRRRVSSGSIDQMAEAPTTHSSTISRGWRRAARTASPAQTASIPSPAA